MGSRRAFGLNISADFALPGVPLGRGEGGPSVSIQLVSREGVLDAWSGASDRPEAVGQVHAERFRVALGANGDYLMTYEGHALYHVNAGADRILCAPSEPDDLAWQRELLDTVLWLTALTHGYETLHASAVDGPDGVVAVVAGSGGGKSSLAAQLIRDGGRLFTDDVVVLESRGADLRCHPGPALMNLPAALPPGAVAELGEPLGAIGDELWVEAHDVTRESRPLAAVCFLDRTASDTPTIEPVIPTPFDLRPHMFVHPFLDGRERSRFHISADLLGSVPMWSLRAPAEATPSELAGLVTGIIPQAPVGAGS